MGAQSIIEAIAGGPVQVDRLLKLDSPFGGDVLIPQRVVASSRLGQHFEFTVDVISTSLNIELKNLIAQPVTLWVQQSDKSYLPHNGYVHTARRLGSDGGLTSYQLVFAPWLHFLKFRRDQRIWQDKGVDEIVADVFNAHPQAQGRFQFALLSPLPSRSYCRQDEDDWNFVHRLLESEGLYGFWQQASDGKSHTFVVTDHLDALDMLPGSTVGFYRAGTGSEADALTQWSGTRRLQSSALSTRTFDYKNPAARFNPKSTSVPTLTTQGALPDQNEVYEYTGAYTWSAQVRGDHLSKIRMEEWESRAKRFYGVGGMRGADAGTRFTLTGHPEHDRDDVNQREFAVIASVWTIENNLPLASDGAHFPHSLQDALASARAGYAGASYRVPHTDGSEGFFLVEIEAQRTAVPFRSPLEHKKPQMHLESAIVVGPKGEEVYTDELNRIKVQFIWDRLNGGDERASCWVRVAQSDTGEGYGGVHMPRVGEEVLIDHIGGDCDRPVVVSRLYNGAAKPQWHSNGLLSGYRSKEYGGSGYNQLVMDDSSGQNRVHLYSSSANSHLHLGYLIEHSGNTRGAYLGTGFDLKADTFGAVRAARGLYISTHPNTSASSQPLDARDAQSQLVNSESVIESLSQVSETHQAESLKDGHDSLKRFTDATQHSVSSTASGGRTAGGGTGSANGFDDPVMVLASPAGIALSTQSSAQISTDQHINLVSGQNTHVATGKSLLVSVTEKVSLFVQNAGMKLFAGKGKVEIRAHEDNVEVTAQKTLKLVSAADKVEAAASKGILLASGGAYIKIENGNIEIHAPGKIDIKGTEQSFAGPVSGSYPLPQLPVGDLVTQYSARFAAVGSDELFADETWVGRAFKIVDDDHNVLAQGEMPESGRLPRVMTDAPKALRLEIGSDDWKMHEVEQSAPPPQQFDGQADAAAPSEAQLAGEYFDVLDHDSNIFFHTDDVKALLSPQTLQNIASLEE
ncbi:type VI secretion system Vgr family protein [Paraburkholderia bannensis]|uniref:type VI secretion system Vgr family protein n=1 Tax=Paraburkholderia bannensis TaxID=765414 RepID=UPI002AB746FC|nr:type VI secretion system Vgr family protein [Paraburkholderia bannensis]